MNTELLVPISSHCLAQNWTQTREPCEGQWAQSAFTPFYTCSHIQSLLLKIRIIYHVSTQSFCSACPSSPVHITLLQPCVPATPACSQLFGGPGLPDPQRSAHTILHIWNVLPCSSHSSLSILLFSAHDSLPQRNLWSHQVWSASLDMCPLKSCFCLSKHFSSACFDIFICCVFD